MLKTSHLSYTFGNHILLNEISLEFAPGQLFGVLGPNGSGKTTFMKTLCGIWRPSHGQVLWKDENLLEKSRREISQIVTFVPQNPQLSFEYSVEDFIAMGRYAHPQKNQKVIDRALELVDAVHLRTRPVQQLSSGERQRVYIGRALATEAPIMLLDEPTASLDIRHQLEIWHLLKVLVTEGKLIIITNHDLEATQRFCDRVAIFSSGKCLISGSNEDVLTPSMVSAVFGVSKSHSGYDLSLI